MNNEIASASYSVYKNKGVFALFLGSGISRSAGIPTGWEIILILIKELAASEKEKCLPTPEEWLKNKHGIEPDYSDLLELLTNTQEERVNLLKPFFEPTPEEEEEGVKKPTVAHRSVAKLVKMGYVRVIITTNFDRLTENALKDEGIEPVVISNPNHIESAPPLIHNKITVVKVNGDYLDTQFLNIKSELTKYEPAIEELLKFIFKNFGLITCGWSAKWDLALVKIMKEAGKFRYTNFFSYINRPDEELKELADQKHGTLLKIESGDNFFTELFENVEALERYNMEKHVTPQIAIARLKKYVVRDEYKVSLHELLHNEVEDVFEKINSVSYVGAGEGEIKSKIDFYLEQVDTLSQMLIHGTYWGSEAQEEQWKNAIIRIASPRQESGAILTSLSNYKYFPALVLLYSVGLACVRRKNFKFLAKLFSSKVFLLNKEVNILSQVNVGIGDPTLLRKALPGSYNLPMSMLLFQTLRGHFKAYIPIDKEFEAVFDYFEFIASTSFAARVDLDWAPPGLFIHRSLHSLSEGVGEKINSALPLQDNFELIRDGLFDDYQEFSDAVSKAKLYWRYV